jgi:hypothetical protein
VSYWETHPLIRTIQEFKEPSNVFCKYVETNTISEENSTDANSDKEHLLLVEEIKDDFKDFLRENGFPENILKAEDLKNTIHKCFGTKTISNTNFYVGRLKVNTSYTFFLKFCNENIEPFTLHEQPAEEKSGSFTDSILMDEAVVVNTAYVYSVYQKWHLRYNKKYQIIGIKYFENYLKHLYSSYYNKSNWSLRIKDIHQNDLLDLAEQEQSLESDSTSIDSDDYRPLYTERNIDIKKLILKEFEDASNL